jgi:hypothetical protein
VILILYFVNKCDGIVISKHHEWMECTSKCFKDDNKASHFGAVLLQEGKDDMDLPNCYFFLEL